MSLQRLNKFDRWEAAEGTLGEEVSFPRLEELIIWRCGSLSALPKGSLLVKQSFGGVETVCHRSAFPALRKLELHDLLAFERWGAVEGTPPGEEVTFPLLEDLRIDDCPKLIDLPEAPKLSELAIEGRGQQMSLQAASRCIPSLSSLTYNSSDGSLHVQPAAMELTGSNFSVDSWDSIAMALLWARSAQLVDLKIERWDALVCWPENLFQALVSLRTLSISSCSNLTGHITQDSDEQSAAAPERGELPPRLESLAILSCRSLVEVPNLPPSLKKLCIGSCGHNIKSIVFGQQEDKRLVSGEGVVRPDTSSLIPGSISSEATASTTAVLKLSSAANHHYLPCLESLQISSCNGLSEVANLPPSIKALYISDCSNVQSLSGQLDAVQKLTIRSCSRLKSLESCVRELRSLEELLLYDCKSLVSLPDGPQAYSSLRVLEITICYGIKLLPPSLQSRLDYLDEKYLDARYEEPRTVTRAVRMLADKAATRLLPCSRKESGSDEGSDSY